MTLCHTIINQLIVIFYEQKNFHGSPCAARSYKLYQKFCAKDVGIDAIKLPSTSPANCAVSLERLVEEYKVILE